MALAQEEQAPNQSRSINLNDVIQTTKITKSTDKYGNCSINQYSFIKTLGVGSFGKVKLALNK